MIIRESSNGWWGCDIRPPFHSPGWHDARRLPRHQWLRSDSVCDVDFLPRQADWWLNYEMLRLSTAQTLLHTLKHGMPQIITEPFHDLIKLWWKEDVHIKILAVWLHTLRRLVSGAAGLMLYLCQHCLMFSVVSTCGFKHNSSDVWLQLSCNTNPRL